MSIKVGFIGTGGIAQAHLSALAKLDGVLVTSVYDVDLDRAEAAAKKVGAKVYEHKEVMIDRGNIDVLFICSPQFARDDTDLLAAERGIHIFVEKPLGLDLHEVIRKEMRIQKSGVLHSSGYCLRYLDTVQQAKSYLRNKQIDLAIAHRFGGLYAPDWWKRLELSGGQLVDQTTHQVDLIRYLAGEFDEVYSRFARRAIEQEDPAATIFDVGTVSFSLDNGAVGSINNTCTLPYMGRSEVEFTGRNFYVGIHGAELRIIDDNQDIKITSRMNFYDEQDKQFIQAIRTGDQDKILCNYTEALKTLAVTLAANQSAEIRQPVRLSPNKMEF
jgi:predicted dehydrogenase